LPPVEGEEVEGVEVEVEEDRDAINIQGGTKGG